MLMYDSFSFVDDLILRGSGGSVSPSSDKIFIRLMPYIPGGLHFRLIRVVIRVKHIKNFTVKVQPRYFSNQVISEYSSFSCYYSIQGYQLF